MNSNMTRSIITSGVVSIIDATIQLEEDHRRERKTNNMKWFNIVVCPHGSDIAHTFSIASEEGSDQDAMDLSSCMDMLCGCFNSVTAATTGGVKSPPHRDSVNSSTTTTTGGGCGHDCMGHRCQCAAPPPLADVAFEGLNPMYAKKVERKCCSTAVCCVCCADSYY